ncbi:glycosyltransferase [Sulfitobacter sp. LCG007]
MERAYLAFLLREPVPLWGLVRARLGYLLLNPAALGGQLAALSGHEGWPPCDLASRFLAGRSPAVRGAHTALRRNASARCTPPGLRAMIARHLPPGTVYINTGHSNLSDRVLDAVRGAGGRIAVMIHDVIPLEHPELQRDGAVERFRGLLQRVALKADVVVYPSDDTRARCRPWLTRHGRVPPGLVAPLGVTCAPPDASVLPEGLPPARAYFVCLGTIEPRKNVGFLLDLWDEMGPDAPSLLLVGARGWKNEDVFARLDALPSGGPVRELPDLPDPAVSALLTRAAALLFPSLAEGYGLPPAEAAALGTPVLCNDLPVLRELMGEIPVYVDVADRLLWRKTITELAAVSRASARPPVYEPPGWPAHFRSVTRVI